MFETFVACLIFFLLCICSWHDWKTYEVPSCFAYILAIISLYSAIVANNTRLFLIAGFIALVLGWALAEFDIWGGADSQLLIVMALFLGFSWYFVILLYTAIVYCIAFICINYYRNKERKIPFVPVFLVSYIIFLVI